MATVTGVTEETTVTMETASQRAIFEASKEKHAPSLIAVCVCVCVCVCACVRACVRARCVFLSHVCPAPMKTHTNCRRGHMCVCVYGAVYALKSLSGQYYVLFKRQ